MSYEDEISEEDIDVMLRVLQFEEPELATREEAKKRLEAAKAEAREMGAEDPNALIDLQKKINKRKDS